MSNINDYTISVVQMNCILDDINYNLQRIKEFTSIAAREGSRLICFPELTITGYDSKSDINLCLDEFTYIKDTLTQISKEYDIIIIAGSPEPLDNKLYNSMLIAYPDGDMDSYKKTHLGMHESKMFSSGEVLNTLPLKDTDYRFGVQICYDMHFPQSTCTLALRDAYIVFAPHASTMAADKRLKTWRKYMPARAYDNRIYLVACNQVGFNGIKNYGGGIGIWGPDGDELYSYRGEHEYLHTITISLNEVKDMRSGRLGHMVKPFYPEGRRGELYI